MENINNTLADMEACPDLDGKSSASCKSGLRPELIEALERAAPVYRSHWWSEHDRANRQWIAQITPIVQQMGVELSGQLAEVYQRPWPSQAGLRVDVVWYGGPFGAYSSLEPDPCHDLQPRRAQSRHLWIRSAVSRIVARLGRRSDRSDCQANSGRAINRFRAISGTRFFSIPRERLFAGTWHTEA